MYRWWVLALAGMVACGGPRPPAPSPTAAKGADAKAWEHLKKSRKHWLCGNKGDEEACRLCREFLQAYPASPYAASVQAAVNHGEQLRRRGQSTEAWWGLREEAALCRERGEIEACRAVYGWLETYPDGPYAQEARHALRSGSRVSGMPARSFSAQVRAAVPPSLVETTEPEEGPSPPAPVEPAQEEAPSVWWCALSEFRPHGIDFCEASLEACEAWSEHWQVQLKPTGHCFKQKKAVCFNFRRLLQDTDDTSCHSSTVACGRYLAGHDRDPDVKVTSACTVTPWANPRSAP